MRSTAGISSRSKRFLPRKPTNTELSGSATITARPRDRQKIEKPKQGTAASGLIISGRYILQPEIFQILELIEKGAGG